METREKNELSDFVARILSHLAKLLVALVLLLALAQALPAKAGGGSFAGATEATQLLNNAELASINIEAMQQTVQDELRNVELVEQTYLQRLQQLEQQVGRYSLPFQRALDGYESTVNTHRKLLGLSSSVDNIGVALLDRFREYSASSLSWAQWLKREQQLIASGDEGARAKMQSNHEALVSARDSIEAYQHAAQQMQQTTGVHGSTQVMGATLALLGQDLNKLIAITAQANSISGQQQQDEAIDRHRKKQTLNSLEQSEQAERQRRQATIERLLSKNPIRK